MMVTAPAQNIYDVSMHAYVYEHIPSFNRTYHVFVLEKCISFIPGAPFTNID